MRRKTTLAGILFLALTHAEHGFSQLSRPANSGYIESTFQAQIGELPQMGWFTLLHGFAAQSNVQTLVLYGPLGTPSTGRRSRLLSRTEVKEIQNVDREACEVDDTAQLTSFEVGGETDSSRAFYTTKTFRSEIRSGLITIPLDLTEIANVNRLLQWPKQGTLRRDDAIGVRAQSFFYSIHKLYNARGQLSQEALVLHGRNGQILAHRLDRDLDSEQPCDGCGIPGYGYGGGSYIPLNMFELPGFAYPVILLDTGTVEGRALTLMTFTPDRQVSEYRIYEYVVHCP